MDRVMLNLTRTTREWKRFARLGIPVFLNAKDQLCFRREQGPNPDAVVVVSVPKSGTYLFGEVLTALGVESTHIHVATYGFQDLRYVSRDFAITQAAETFVMIPSDKTLPLVLSGQQVVSHFPFTPDVHDQLKRFKILFTYRDVRDTFVSTMRWVAKKGKAVGSPEGWEDQPDSPEKMLKFIEKHGAHYLWDIKCMKDWTAQPGVLSLSFEELQGDFGPDRQTRAVQRIADLVGIPLPEGGVGPILEKSLGKETLTFSGKRSSRDGVWSDKVDKFFRDYGADEIDAFWKQFEEK
jgi:Sulfotransferase domain